MSIMDIKLHGGKIITEIKYLQEELKLLIG